MKPSAETLIYVHRWVAKDWMNKCANSSNNYYIFVAFMFMALIISCVFERNARKPSGNRERVLLINRLVASWQQTGGILSYIIFKAGRFKGKSWKNSNYWPFWTRATVGQQ